jgi:uncharacterized protein YdaU (DUF1376 family)
LSFVEDAAYSRMIRKYYAEEKPLPADPAKVARLIGARSREEREAVQTVLDEFFTLEDDGWHNKRCDEELSKWTAQAETNRQIAEERERKKRERIVRDHDNESCNESSTLTEESREPNQKPEARSQKETPPSPLAVAKGVNGHGKRKRKPTTPCPESIEITDAMYDWANSRGLKDEQVAHETEAMISWHVGKGTEWSDWKAAWRTWMLNAIKFAKEKGLRQ